MRYFCLVDINNTPLENSLFRYREANQIIFEEFWNSSSQKWEPTTDLTKLIVGGDCATTEISKESAQLIKGDNSK